MVKTNRPTLGLIAAAAVTVLVSGSAVAHDVDPDPDQLHVAQLAVGIADEGKVEVATEARIENGTDSAGANVEPVPASASDEVMPGLPAAAELPTVGDASIGGDQAPAAELGATAPAECSSGLPGRRLPCLR